MRRLALGLCALACLVGQSSRMRADLDFLTSDVLAGRLSLTPQAEITARYIAADFQKVAEDPIIAERLGDTGQIMSVLGPGEFGARVQEQRDKLAALAKTLGLKAAQ